MERHPSSVEGVAPSAWTLLMTACVMCERHCAGITLDRKAGVVPRAFGFGDPGEKRLAVIFGEPGGISGRAAGTGERELRLYAEQRTPAGLLSAVNAFTDRCFRTGTWDGQANPFHRRVADLLREVFGSTERAMQACYFTNLTKCEKADASIPWSTRSTCFSTYLREEIHILRPRAALLFGDNAAAFASQIEALGTRTITAKHPSARPPDWLRGPARSTLVRRIRVLTGDANGPMTIAQVDAATGPDEAEALPPPLRGPVTRRGGGASLVEPLPWIRDYFARLVANPPRGTTVARDVHMRHPGVRISGGPVLLDLWAHREYIRVGIHTTDLRVYHAVRAVPGFEVVHAAKAWFTGYINEPAGTSAIDLLIRGAC